MVANEEQTIQENIVKVSLDEIKPYEKNNKIHPEKQITILKESIRKFGFTNPIQLEKDNTIIAGHGRYQALTELRSEYGDSMPVKDGKENLDLTTVKAVYVQGLSKSAIKALRILDNRSAELAETNWAYVREEFVELQEEGLDFYTGYAEEDMPKLKDEGRKIEEDKYIPVPIDAVKTDIKDGDVIKLGNHILICGDATKREYYDKVIQDEKVSLVLTDPPYNVDYGNKNTYLNNGDGGNRGNKLGPIANDNMSSSEFYNFLSNAFKNTIKKLKKGGCFYVFYADREAVNFRTAIVNAGGLIKQTIIWVKNGAVISRQDYNWRHEPVIYGWREGNGHYFIGDFTYNTVFEEFEDLNQKSKTDLIKLLKEMREASNTTAVNCAKPLKNDLHPTMKPLELLGKFIINSSKAGEIVLDPFAGSGSTLLACEQADRKCVMIEYEPRYCEVICDRWEKFTGKKREKQ